MEDYEKISGKKIHHLIKKLLDERTVIKMHLVGQDFDRLTIVIDIRTKGGIIFFLIDYPRGFRRAIANMDSWPIRFEFKGKDKIPCLFRTSEGEIKGDEIWIQFPKSIERRQRRKHFRLSAPVGTRMYLTFDSEEHEMSVLDVSQEGACVSPGSGKRNEPFLQPGDLLSYLRLMAPSIEGSLRIRIKEAVVRRFERDPLTHKYRYGLQFINIERDKKNELKDFIYSFQRVFLRKR